MSDSQKSQEQSLAVSEIASRLGVSRITVYRHLKRGTLPSFKFGGSLRVLEQDLAAFIYSQGVGKSAEGYSVRSTAPPDQPMRTFKNNVQAWLEIIRPFSWTASIVPVTLSAAIAWRDGTSSTVLLGLIFLGSLLLQAGTNVINELFDVHHGVDTKESPRASKVLVQRRLGNKAAYKGGLVIFGLAALVGAYLVSIRGYPVILLGVVGVLTGYFYTAPPIHFKYRALGIPIVFVAMGPLMVVGAYYVLTNTATLTATLASLPIGLLVAAILHANDVRDVKDDAQAGFKTLATLIGQRQGGKFYVGLILSPFVLTTILWLAGVFSPWSMLVLVALIIAVPALVTMIRAIRQSGDPGITLATIDVATAKVHLVFGIIFSATFILEKVL